MKKYCKNPVFVDSNYLKIFKNFFSKVRLIRKLNSPKTSSDLTEIKFNVIDFGSKKVESFMPSEGLKTI